MRRHWCCALAGALTMAPRDMPAQTVTPPRVETGARVRIWAPSLGRAPRIGVVTRLDSDQLTLSETSPTTRTWIVSLPQIQRIDVERPGAGSRAGRWTVLGLLGGAVTMGAAGLLFYRCDDGCNGEDGAGVLLAIPGAVIGGVVGGLAGHSVKTTGWKQVGLPVRVGIAPPLNGRWRLAGSFSF